MTNQFLNLHALEKSQLQTDPFPFLIIDDILLPTHKDLVVDNFPAINYGGSVAVSSVKANEVFKHFIQEIEGPALRSTIAKKFSINLDDKPTMLTLRGQTRQKDGRIHTDSKDKMITVLIYLNKTWGDDNGRLRILRNNHSLEDYVAEVSPHAGSCLIFLVTDNCWHGHKPFVGERHSLQLNYLVNQQARLKHINQHRFSAKIKSWFKIGAN